MTFIILNDGCAASSIGGAVDVPLHEWGRRLSDTLRAALVREDYAAAGRLAREGDGQARSLAKEYAFMIRGLDLTIQILLRLLGETIEHSKPQTGSRTGSAAADDLVDLVCRFRAGLAGSSERAPEARQPLADELASAGRVLGASRARFEEQQAQLAQDALEAIEEQDGKRALAHLDAKENLGYMPLHDLLVRFMADSFAWVLRHYGPDELLRFHLATAEAQRPGFEKWEGMSAAEFARTSAFLLKQHMGEVTVDEDAEKFTISQTPCGSGGRLQRSGAYSGPTALPWVTTRGPLTFGQPRLPVYCSHCAIWNGTATLRWFGHAQWVFENPARSDGGCTLHIYKRSDGAPPEYAAMVAVPND
ncbi:MAG: hypothetical protein KJZ80_14585 [Hyphomicrobiaceae bacterium]|nr:hypothetical protein [Hyphomicrobiaceae bacterium]